MKFRKKPVIIEAEQFFRSTTSLINNTTGVCQCEKGDRRGHVHTTHNDQVVNLENGDWVIPEPNGTNYYPCKDEIFRNTYDSIETEKA